MKKLLFFLFLYSSLASAQTLSGYVFDDVSKEPMIGASVYFDGSSIGVITDEEGYFSLTLKRKLTSPLVISYIGYNDVQLESPWEYDTLKIYLKPKAVQLSEIILTADPFTRQQKLRAFRREFLGSTRGGKSCKILNEGVIDLYYDMTKKELIATSDEPIIIQNKYLGYELRYKLIDSKISYSSVSLSELDINEVFYVGTCFFIDKQENIIKNENRRQREYKGSLLHLMRATSKKEWEAEGFTFFKGSFQVNPEKYFTIVDSLGMKKVSLPHKLTVLYKKHKRSAMHPKSDYYFIDGYGNFYSPEALTFSGVIGTKRIGDLLPLDYNLKD